MAGKRVQRIGHLSCMYLTLAHPWNLRDELRVISGHISIERPDISWICIPLLKQTNKPKDYGLSKFR